MEIYNTHIHIRINIFINLANQCGSMAQRQLVALMRCKVVYNPNLDTKPFVLHQTAAT